jgi:hypothetical protein
MPYTQSYTVGWQRKLTNDTAFELRYVGSRHRQDWETQNINEISISDNGFAQEFRKAQANLQANIAAGRGNTFAYTGAAGTSPLPTFLAFFQGLPSGQAGNSANYTSTQFNNATNLGFLAAQNPNPFGFASVNSTSGFVGNAGFRTNGMNAGLPANFFLANPDALGGTANNSGGANLTTNFGGTRANSIQLEFRKRLSNGLAYSTSYAWASAYMMQRYGFQHDPEEIAQAARSATSRMRSRATGSTSCRSARASGGAATPAASSTRFSAAGSSTASAASRPASRSTSATSAWSA